MMDYDKIGANIVVELTKNLTDECLLCTKQITANIEIMNNSKDLNVVSSAENIARYYEIRLQTVIDIMERISNIMREEKVPLLSHTDILTIFECENYEELQKKRTDPEAMKKFKENLKKHMEEQEKKYEN